MAKKTNGASRKAINGKHAVVPQPLVPFVIENVALASLKPHPRNYKHHSAEQVEHIGASLKQFGAYRNVVVARDDVILAGHGVVQAAGKIGWTTFPVRRVDVESGSPQALKILALDNELGRFADSDDRGLSEILRDVRDRDEFGLLGTGYDDQNFMAFLMVTRPADEIRDFAEAAEWVGLPEYDLGIKLIRLIVSFETEEDRVKFVALKKIKVTKTTLGTWSSRWPEVEEEAAHSMKFKNAR